MPAGNTCLLQYRYIPYAVNSVGMVVAQTQEAHAQTRWRTYCRYFRLLLPEQHLIYIWADANLYRPVTVQRSNFPLSYPMTAKSFMEKHGWLDRQEYAKRLDAQGIAESEHIRYPLNKLAFNDQVLAKMYLSLWSIVYAATWLIMKPCRTLQPLHSKT